MTVAVYLRQKFDSFDEFNSFPNGWDTEFREAGARSGALEIETLFSGNVLLNTAAFGQPTIQAGSTPSGMRTFALPARPEAASTWLDRQISTRSLMLFPDTGELFCVAGGAMEMATVSVADTLFDDLAREMEENSPARLAGGDLCETEGERWAQLHRNIRIFASFSRDHGQGDQMASWHRYFEEELTVSLLECFSGPETVMPKVHSSAAANHVRRATDYILAHLGDPLTVSQLARELDVSRRSLEYSFARGVGLSPKQFILELRLSRCHAELLAASKETTSVAATANRLGIWHLGAFARAYCARYGELPSETLLRRAH